MEHAGYKTQQGYDGSTAINLLSLHEPDVLLLDIVIPEPDGMAVLAKALLFIPSFQSLLLPEGLVFQMMLAQLKPLLSTISPNPSIIIGFWK